LKLLNNYYKINKIPNFNFIGGDEGDSGSDIGSDAGGGDPSGGDGDPKDRMSTIVIFVTTLFGTLFLLWRIARIKRPGKTPPIIYTEYKQDYRDFANTLDPDKIYYDFDTQNNIFCKYPVKLINKEVKEVMIPVEYTTDEKILEVIGKLASFTDGHINSLIIINAFFMFLAWTYNRSHGFTSMESVFFFIESSTLYVSRPTKEWVILWSQFTLRVFYGDKWEDNAHFDPEESIFPMPPTLHFVYIARKFIYEYSKIK
jgi:hypothetical protein